MKYATCEIPNCAGARNHKTTKPVGTYQVYDNMGGKMIQTMTRPARMCQECINFAKECGMTVTEIVEK